MPNNLIFAAKLVFFLDMCKFFCTFAANLVTK